MGYGINSTHFLYNGNKWYNYRIGDLVLHEDLNKGLLKDMPFVGTNYHKSRFPHSLAAEYEQKDMHYEPDESKIEFIKSLIKQRKIRKTDFVLHMRVGDVLTKFSIYKEDFFKQDHWWESLIDYIKKNNLQRVIIMAGCHINEGIQESVKYIEEKRLLFEKENLKVLYRFASSPDEDLLFVSNAKHYSSTGGRYGKLLGHIVKSFGGNVF